MVGIIRNEAVDLCRDLRLGRPLEHEGDFAPAPAFWSCANKMMAYLLAVAEHPEGRGIRPHSIKATTISALMTEVAKGQVNLAQLAIRGNYRGVAAQDMPTGYSRNIARRQLFRV